MVLRFRIALWIERLNSEVKMIGIEVNAPYASHGSSAY